ncbi:MAG: RelA/SpoT AH/RIS domain-containing protein, partial [Pseudomonadota bacterium]
RLDFLRESGGDLVGRVIEELRQTMAKAYVDATISGREKSPYSIWRKMERKSVSFEQLADIMAFRIEVESIGECYQALGAIHSRYPVVPSRFKDYISTPKPNGYRSLHTGVFGPERQRIEIQIRTHKMMEQADFGVAAHWSYKQDVQAVEGTQYRWLRDLLDVLESAAGPEEFLEHTKLELFHDQVFCFTPKGRLIALPRGATPIDFAYAVHTDVGNTANGAIVNGRPMPMSTVLRNGDEVDIQRSETHTPPAAWERVAATGRARSAIRRAARDALRRQYVELGRRLLEAACLKANVEFSDDRLEENLSRFSVATVEDVLVSIGRGELSVKDALKGIEPEAVHQSLTPPRFFPRNRHDHGKDQDGWFNLARVMGLKFYLPGGSSAVPVSSAGKRVPIRGFKQDLPVTFQEGGAVPGDRIVGVLVPNEGIKIFQIHSPKLREFESANWVDVTWDIDPTRPERFPSKVSVTAINEPGSLAKIAEVIGVADGNIDNLRMVKRASDYTEMLIEIDVWNLEHLNSIISGLRAIPVVNKVERLFE